MPRSPRDAGQATVEFVALLPLVAVVAALLWQAVVAGHAVWVAGGAARSAARAAAVGMDAGAAARRALTPGLRRGLRVRASPAGVVSVSVRVPAVAPWIALGRYTARAAFPRQAP